MRPGGKSNGESPFFETPNLSFEGRVGILASHSGCLTHTVSPARSPSERERIRDLETCTPSRVKPEPLNLLKSCTYDFLLTGVL